MKPPSRRTLSALLAGLLGAACGESGKAPPNPLVAVPPPAPAPAPAPTVNVILILVDTLRADALLDPEHKYDTPNLDRLAQEGVPFPRVFSAAPMTLPSHMSLFSSRPVLETKVFNNGQNVPTSLPLLADWLSGHGYHSRAVLSLGTLNPLDAQESPSRGFASYDYNYWDISLAEKTEERLLASLAQRDTAKPLFLFAHFSDPHEPYEAHGTELRHVQLRLDGEPLAELRSSDMEQWTQTVQLTEGRNVFEFQSPEKGAAKFRVRRFECRENGQALPLVWEEAKEMSPVASARVVVDRGARAPGACEVRAWINDVPATNDVRRTRYALEVAYVDRYIGELLAELERLGLYQDSLVLFTSDHGEALGEHKFFGHVEYLTDELIHVPLIVKLPRGDARKPALVAAAGKVVSHIDLVPTVLEVVGLPPLPGQRGQSLFTPHDTLHIAQTSRPEATRRGNQLAFRDERFKLIYYADEERFELYDLEQDPLELTDVFAERKGERAAWPEQLFKLYQHSQERTGLGNGDDREEREKMLRALGYGGEE
ncbi:MAG: hypothetical protein EXS08_12085 [Planctomycetes bacterium]|nr:hypothetical protein [Planctomycetota bacterium]